MTLNDPHPNQRLRGQLALITGASQGIGAAIARALAAEGCDLVLSSRNQAALDQLSSQLEPAGIRILPKACDVRDPSAVDSLFSAIAAEFRGVDLLINNAGISHAMADIGTLTLETWRAVIETNLTGTFLVTRAALPLMERGGTIVNNLSVAAKGIFAGEAAYCASKHGALGFTNTLREELRPKGIRVTALIAGATNTELWNQFWPEAPRQKMMSVETVAAALVNLLVLPHNTTVEELVITPTAGAL